MDVNGVGAERQDLRKVLGSEVPAVIQRRATAVEDGPVNRVTLRMRLGEDGPADGLPFHLVRVDLDRCGQGVEGRRQPLVEVPLEVQSRQ